MNTQRMSRATSTTCAPTQLNSRSVAIKIHVRPPRRMFIVAAHTYCTREHVIADVSTRRGKYKELLGPSYCNYLHVYTDAVHKSKCVAQTDPSRTYTACAHLLLKFNCLSFVRRYVPKLMMMNYWERLLFE